MSTNRKRLFLFLAAAAVGGFLFLRLFSGPAEPKGPVQSPQAIAVEQQMQKFLQTEKSYSTLLSDLRQNKVKMLALTQDGNALVELGSGQRYYVNRPAPAQLLTPLLEPTKGAGPEILTINASTTPGPGGVASAFMALVSLSPLLLTLLLIGLMLYSLPRGGRGLEVTKDTGVRFNDVIGAGEAKAALQEVVDYLRKPDMYSEIGARAPRGVLLEGPPGTGKTLLAKAVAGECGVPFFSINGADFSAPLVGIGVMRVKNLFKAARRAAPCVIFIDEFDSLGNRDAFSFGGAAEAENRKIINKVLTELDGFGPNSGVIVIAATNNGASLDKALVREGRFDRRCTLGLPNLPERKAILEHYAGKLRTAPEVDFSALARRSAGMTPAALSAVVNKAGILALKRGKTTVGQEEFTEGMAETQMGSPSAEMRRLMTPETRERVALHEAGHALVAFRLEAGVVEGVTILPRSRALGLTLLTQDEGQNQLLTSQDLLNHVCVLLGGREAERLVYSDPSSGARDDLEKASGITLAMVSQFGMGDGPTRPFNLDAVPPAARQMEIGKLLPEAAAILQRCEKRTNDLLQEDLPLLLALRSALLERETLDRQEVEAILSGDSSHSSQQSAATIL